MRYLILLLATILSLQTWGQTKLSAAQQNQIIDKVTTAAKSATTLQCEFTQTKTMKMLKRDMVSKGIMYYKSPDKLRWQYTSPYDYTFILNGGQVRIKSTKSSQNIDLKNNKMFKQLSQIILGSITGGGLKNNSNFTVEVYMSGESYVAKLTPRTKELKQIYTIIEVYFNKSLTMVNSVKLVEKTGDVTIVKLYNIKTGVSLNESQFNTK